MAGVVEPTPVVGMMYTVSSGAEPGLGTMLMKRPPDPTERLQPGGLVVLELPMLVVPLPEQAM